ncbi:uncharacterized protein LOC110277569 isoform X1 [Arachis duranensis]|uniref:Uncharacterized protein LOC110277569 isoform X1 n=1 Tax=Arachis duranensis TaxID=130453 RepID=A0A6P5N156_ARADU|nr:uncharacterized protein LOC110277569 isoform X1 [Arachis duranensis]XP_025641496.1 uncharacterized protein LOC112736315 isoform X1 [Arachis hypogaea]QHO52423.1 uncharacterized protein DS421_2g39230 [Arachis hypogaea]
MTNISLTPETFLSKVEGRRECFKLVSGIRSATHMASQGEADLIPVGWTLETYVKKDGSKILFYYCSATGQHFATYFELMRYVNFAQTHGVGIYNLADKSVRRIESQVRERNVAGFEQKAALSLPRKPSSNLNSLDY